MALARTLSAAGALLLLHGCGHEWDIDDPRLDGAGGGATAAGPGSGGAAASASSGGGSSAAGGTGTGATGAGGGGAATSSGGAGSGGELPVGLVAAYGFEEGSGRAVLDATPNGNDGVITGATWVAGKQGGALAFDGLDDRVTVAADASWKKDGLAAYTFEAWVKANVPLDYRGAVAVGSWATQGMDFLVQNGEWRFSVATAGGPNAWPCAAASGPLSYLEQPDGQFHHLAGVLDTEVGECRFYVDGVLVGIDIYVDGTTSFGPGDLVFGGYDSGNYLACEIDDVRIYQRALSEAEIQADMATPVGP